MSERPRMFGSEEDRAALERAAAAPPVAPELLRLRTWRAVEERRRTPRRRGWWLAAALLAGSAGVYAAASRRAPVEPPALPVPAPSPSAAPRISPAPEAPSPVLLPRRRPARVRRVARALGGLPPWPLRDDPPVLEEEERGLAAPSPRLLIAREGQGEVSVALAGNRVVGVVRGTPVDLTIEPGQITGKLGHRNVSLWMRGDRAEGEIGGIPVRMEVVETRTGHQLREGFSVRASLGLPSTRVETRDGSLSWFPDCQIPQLAEGTYQGRCERGGETRVVIPPGWQRLPVLPRLTLLSFFLTERAPAISRLFGSGE